MESNIHTGLGTRLQRVLRMPLALDSARNLAITSPVARGGLGHGDVRSLLERLCPDQVVANEDKPLDLGCRKEVTAMDPEHPPYCPDCPPEATGGAS